MRSLAVGSSMVLTIAALGACSGGKPMAVGGAYMPTGGATGSGGARGTGGGTGTGGGGGSGADGGTGGGAPQGEPYVYVGGYGSVVHVFHLNRADGSLQPVGTPVPAGTNPSFLAFDPTHHTLLVVNEDSGGKGAVASLRIDQKTGELTFLNRVSSQGDGPAHVSTDRTGAFAFVANYGGGTVAVLPLAPGGMLGAAIDVHAHGGGANPHQMVADAANRFVFVPNKGLNTVTQYAFDAPTGKLTGNGALDTAPGAGPRHLDFHPSAPYAYLIDEIDSTMTALSYDAAGGKLANLQTLSTLPAGYQGSNTGAEVQVAPSGKFVYGSNRGHDSIAVFHVEGNGKLTLVGHQPVMGKTPRHFQIEPSGELLLVANQDSGNVVTFRVDTAAGTLTPTGQSAAVPSPSYVGVIYLASP